MTAQTRLATYGTLSPGQSNHRQLADLHGAWSAGVVRGRRLDNGWQGYPGFILDPAGDAVTVHLLESLDLPAHWTRLDAFEGAGYRRVAATVETAEGPLEAFIYVLAGAPD